MTPRLHALILLAFAALLFGLPGVAAWALGAVAWRWVAAHDKNGAQR